MSREGHDWFRGRRVLVIGGAGFMGQYLVAALAGLGSELTILCHTSPLPEHLAGLEPSVSTNVKISCGDVRDASMVAKLVAGQEVIYALAGRSGVTQSNARPLDDLDANCRGLLTLLECCRAFSPTIRIVFPSSRLVYSKAQTLPVPEDHPTQPRSIYGIHKLTSEKYLALYHTLYGMQTVILRISNPYGFERQPGTFTHGIVNHFFRKALRGETLTIFGDGTQRRDYVYIDDVVDAFLVAGRSNLAPGHVFNVGSGQGTSLAAAAYAVARLVGSGKVEHAVWPPDYLMAEAGDYVADVKKIQTVLGWSPRTPWENGLRKVHARWLEGAT